MNQQEVKTFQYPSEITGNPVSQLGSKRFEKLIASFSSEQLRLSMLFHQDLLREQTNNIVRGTAFAVAAALLYRLGPQHEMIQMAESAGMVIGAALGTLGVYGRSACVDGINLLSQTAARQRLMSSLK